LQQGLNLFSSFHSYILGLNQSKLVIFERVVSIGF
jgi:hypothetical protein